jgi:hypothetical protein
VENSGFLIRAEDSGLRPPTCANGQQSLPLFGRQLGKGYPTAQADHTLRDFVEATALAKITDREIQGRFQKRAHHTLLRAAGFNQTDISAPLA